VLFAYNQAFWPPKIFWLATPLERRHIWPKDLFRQAGYKFFWGEWAP